MSEFDMDSAVADIGNSLGFDKEEAEVPDKAPIEKVADKPAEKPLSEKPLAQPDQAGKVVVTDAPVVRSAPKSWAQDKAEVWSKLTPEAQDQIELREKQMLEGLEQYKEHNNFGRTMRDVFTPYRAMMHAQGIDEVKATQYLLNAHYRLSEGSPQSRLAAYQELGARLGFVQPNQQQVDPAMRAVDERVARMEQAINQENQRRYEETRGRVSTEVSSFAKDNPYFDEVSEDIVNLIHAAHARGETPDLKSIYDKAVWANPVTRQKELARTQQENEKALLEKSKQEADAAKKARASNVRGRDTQRAPTEQTGSMDDTMRETLKKIQARAH